MSYKNKLSVGLAVDIGVTEGEYEGTYRTLIEEVGEKIISVGALFQQGQVVPLREGTKVKLTFWDETSAYSFQAKIMQRIAYPVPIFVLELPNTITKVQRRNFVRVPAIYPLAFRIVNKEGLSDLYKATLIEMSGGGMRFETEVWVENNSLLFTHLTIPNGDLQSPVRVCRSEKIENSKRYMVSVEFQSIQERDRDRIVRCVFDIQRSMRKKGLE